jgi:hypothetical protein
MFEGKKIYLMDTDVAGKSLNLGAEWERKFEKIGGIRNR